jgi:hypothetical protein
LWEPGLHLYCCRSIYFRAQGFFFRLATSHSFSLAKTTASALVHFLIELFAIASQIPPPGLWSVIQPCLILGLSIKSFFLPNCPILVQFLFIDVLQVPLERVLVSLCLVPFLPTRLELSLISSSFARGIAPRLRVQLLECACPLLRALFVLLDFGFSAVQE